jgi:hypothetical protein
VVLPLATRTVWPIVSALQNLENWRVKEKSCTFKSCEIKFELYSKLKINKTKSSAIFELIFSISPRFIPCQSGYTGEVILHKIQD